MDFVTIGNPGNAADPETLAGSVDYTYNLGKFEISRDQINKANAAGGLGITLSDMSSYGGNGPNKPATGISWYEAAKFVNYLNTSQGKQVAYNLNGNGNLQPWGAGQFSPGFYSGGYYSGNNVYRHKDAYYFLPITAEWYKGAFGSPSGAYYNYPTGSDSLPIAVLEGKLHNSAVYGQGSDGLFGSIGPADVTSAGGLSAYGTMAQGGNVREWIENPIDGFDNIGRTWDNRENRGGSWYSSQGDLGPSSRRGDIPQIDGIIGFRVASIPEPSSLSLLVLGGAVVALCRRKRA